jgi:Mg-chelatase subunit ChlI
VEDDTRKLRQKIEKAKEFLKKIVVADGAMRLAATYSAEASCAGQRAEIDITETARAIAALDMRTAVNAGDIAEAAKYALPHRMRAIFRGKPWAVPEDEAEGWKTGGRTMKPDLNGSGRPMMTAAGTRKRKDGADEPRDEKKGKKRPKRTIHICRRRGPKPKTRSRK